MDLSGIGSVAGGFWGGVIAGGIGAGLISLVAVYLIKNLLLSDTVLKYLSSHVDEIIDSVQKKDEAVGRAIRERLIVFAEKVIKELKAPNGIS
uniref:Holin n=1 Tax=viral metagenome TaxID=1070528 RepID=A0A6H1ZBR1_9ZZZZ